jgi:acetyl esterase/lipase
MRSGASKIDAITLSHDLLMYRLKMTHLPGSWNSPISAKLLTGAATHLWGVQTVGDDVLWGELRPTESGRVTIVSKKYGVILPAPWDASSSVHEYGGTAWFGYESNNSLHIVFVNKSDQRLYTFQVGRDPVALTPDTQRSHRYLEMIYVDGEIWCLREIVAHDGKTSRDLVAVTADGIRVLDSNSHFYAYLSLSPDKKHASFIGWEHPQMPWDGTELFVVDIENGAFVNRRALDGNTTCSLLHPIWADNENIYYISDESGWWNPWKISLSGKKQQLIKESSEWAGPIWTLGLKFLALATDGKILAVHGDVDNQKLTILDPETGKSEDIENDFNHFAPYFATSADRLYVVCAGPTISQALIEVNLTTRQVTAILYQTEVPLDKKYLTKPYQIVVPGKAGRKVFAIMHPAHNPDVEHAGPTPLIVTVHGGPTDHVSATLNLKFNYFTSRGIAVVDVNYGGSTGYGREYRRALNGKWGILDREDCISVVEHLVEVGIAHKDQILVRGGSAGGFTVLNVLVNSDLFAAGASYFGVASLEGFALDTHDFESRYLDSMIGPYPERRDLYIERSPITHAENLTSPLILFQGLDDKVVPPEQSRAFRDVCLRNGIKHEYHEYVGEGHGFGKAVNQIHCIEHEINFYGEVLGFTPFLL